MNWKSVFTVIWIFHPKVNLVNDVYLLLFFMSLTKVLRLCKSDYSRHSRDTYILRQMILCPCTSSDPDKILATCSTVRASVHVLRGQKVRKEDKEGQSNITVTWKKERNSGCHHLSLGKWGPSNTIISSKWVLLFQKHNNNNKRKNLNGHWKLRDGVSLMRIMMMRDVGPTELQSTRASVQFVLTCTDDCRREEKRACVIRTINHFDHFGHRQLGLPVTVEFL